MPIKYEMQPGYDVGQVRETIRTNSLRGLPLLSYGTVQGGSIAIAGNGPSLRTCRPTASAGSVAALNGAWRALPDPPDYIVVADPCEENAEWFENAPETSTYLLASRVHPSVFAKLRGKKIKLWHVLADEEVSLLHSSITKIGGGSTIALKALNLFAALGFTHIDLYGVDSSYALDGSDHASPQNWNTEQERIPVRLDDGKLFVSCPWMIAQAQEAAEQIALNSRDYTVEVHGDGFLREFIDHHTLETVYDLNSAPASFDFLSWLMNVECYRQIAGYCRLKVRFRAGTKDGFRPNEPIFIEPKKRQDLLNNVCRPGLRLFGASEGGDKENELKFPYVIFPTVFHYLEYKELPVMRPSAAAQAQVRSYLGDQTAPIYTITLRELDNYWPERNSEVESWLKFAKTLSGRVIFVRDTARATESIDGFEIYPPASLDIHCRLALYEQATMNFFVSNGPTVLGIYSKTVPYLCFMKSPVGYPCHRPDWIERYVGISFGGQFPWVQLKNQRLFWGDDSYENIEAEWAKMQRRLSNSATRKSA